MIISCNAIQTNERDFSETKNTTKNHRNAITVISHASGIQTAVDEENTPTTVTRSATRRRSTTATTRNTLEASTRRATATDNITSREDKRRSITHATAEPQTCRPNVFFKLIAKSQETSFRLFNYFSIINKTKLNERKLRKIYIFKNSFCLVFAEIKTDVKKM